MNYRKQLIIMCCKLIIELKWPDRINYMALWGVIDVRRRRCCFVHLARLIYYSVISDYGACESHNVLFFALLLFLLRAWSLESERKLFEKSPANSFWFFRLYSDEWTTINEKFESNEIFLFTDKKIYNKIGVACFQCLWNMKMRCQQPDNDINEYYASWYEKYPVINKISDICLHVRIECICSEMSSMMFDVMIFHVYGRMHINNWCIVIEHQQQQQQNK